MNVSFLLKPIKIDCKVKQHTFMYMILSFLIPFIVMSLALIALHITPFGNHNLAISDARYYLNGLMWFSRLLKGQENIFYSFNNGLGGNEWRVFAWGGFSFGSLLSIFAKIETIPSVFTWICVVNLAICGLNMYILLNYVNGYNISNLIFSTSYALIGFNIVDWYQIGFVLGPEMLPLVILGLILLFRGKNPLIYIFSLGFCSFFNFYFAFHLCVISFIYFLAYLYVHEKVLAGKQKSFVMKWFFSSVIGGLLGAPMWLPALKAYSGGGRLNQTGVLEYTFDENMPFIHIFSKLFSGANSKNELMLGLPNIFCGILVVALVILYFMNKKIDIKRKRAAGIVLTLYLITFYIHAFTLVMHGGTHTNWFPYRYSYVFSFLLICLAVEEFRFIDEITIEETKRCGAILLGIVLIVFSISYEFISGGMVVLDLVLLFMMWMGFWFYKTKPDKAPIRTFSLLLMILVSINLYANMIISTKKVQEWELNLNEYSKNIMVSGAQIDALNMAEKDFFRMEKDKSESDNIGADPALYNYNGVSHSGPAERMFIHKQLNKLGINWFDMRHWYEAGVPAATDILLGLKYILSDRDLEEEKGYEHRIEMMGTAIFQSSYPLSVAVLSEGDISSVELGEDAFQNLNAVWKGMTGEDKDIFTEQEDVTYSLFSDYSNQSVTSKELKESTSNSMTRDDGDHLTDSEVSGVENEEAESSAYIQYSFKVKQDGPIYYFDTSIPASGKGLDMPSMRYVGTYKTGDVVEGKIPLSAENGSGKMMRGYCANLVFAYADNGVLAKYAKKLNARACSFKVLHENDLEGSFTAEEGQRILFTIPWDEGWTCYIDGQKVNIDKTWDLFMSVNAPAGKHSYEIKFFPAWLNYGLILFGIAFSGLIIFMIVWKKDQKSEKMESIQLEEQIKANKESENEENPVSEVLS